MTACESRGNVIKQKCNLKNKFNRALIFVILKQNHKNNEQNTNYS